MNNDTYNRIQAINIDTGEVLGTAYIKTNGSEELILKAERKRVLTPEQRMFLNNKNEFKNQCKELGGFVHMIYAKNELLFNSLGIDKANVSRIIYLATYLDYSQDGLLIMKHRDVDGRFIANAPMTRKEMQKVLNLGNTAFRSFLKNMKENELLFELDKAFLVNTNYFIKGKVNIDNEQKNYCRLFIDTIRQLYEGCDARKHKTLANVYQLIPFVHYSNNLICHNPNALQDKIRVMSLKEIGELLNIQSDKNGNLKRLSRELSNFYITVNDKKLQLFKHYYDDDGFDAYFINPYVVYSGNNVTKLRWIADTYFFRSSLSL